MSRTTHQRPQHVSSILDAQGRPFVVTPRPARRAAVLRYDAARMDRVRTRARAGSADGDLLPDLQTLREKSRALTRDDAHAAAAVRVLVDNVVGCGIRPQAAVSPESSGLTQAQCNEFNDELERLWWEWAEDMADANELNSFDDLTRLVYRQVVVDGEALAHRVVVHGRNHLSTSWELIDPDRLEDPTQANLGTTRLGVELGDRGQPVAYWITPYHPDDLRYQALGKLPANNLPQRYARMAGGLHNVLHVYRRDRAGQSRGIPLITAALPLFEHLHHYLDSEIIAARANSNVAMFIRRPLDKTDPNLSPFQDAGRDGETVYHETIEPGTIEYLNEGEEIAPYMPNRPGTTFDPFVTRILRAICASVGLPYEMVARDFGGMNYSSSRVALLESRRAFEAEQNLLVNTWLRPVWETFVREAIATGRLPVYAVMAERLRAFFAVRWIRAAWGWVDPTKEIGAAEAAIAANLSTPDIEASRAGLDVDEILEARARFHVKARDIEERNGLAPGTLTGGSAQQRPAPAAPQEPDDDDQAEDDAGDTGEDTGEDDDENDDTDDQ